MWAHAIPRICLELSSGAGNIRFRCFRGRRYSGATSLCTFATASPCCRGPSPPVPGACPQPARFVSDPSCICSVPGHPSWDQWGPMGSRGSLGPCVGSFRGCLHHSFRCHVLIRPCELCSPPVLRPAPPSRPRFAPPRARCHCGFAPLTSSRPSRPFLASPPVLGLRGPAWPSRPRLRRHGVQPPPHRLPDDCVLSR